MTTQLVIQDLHKSFSDLEVLRGINLEVAKGQLLSVIGTSGGGKTTLLRLIAGFETPSRGVIRLNDQTISTPLDVLAPEQRQIGIVPQEPTLFPHLSVFDNVSFGLRRFSREEKRARVGYLLSLVRLSELENRFPHELSGGQQQRVAIARALAPEPKLLLLDEPFAALDAHLRAEIRHDVRSVLDELSMTAIMVTHDQDEALSIADAVAVLRDGVIVQMDSPRAIYNRPVDSGVATFLGDAVLVEGVIEGNKVKTELGSLSLSKEFPEGTVGRVAIRPENFYLQPHLDGESIVIGRQFFGHDAIIDVKTPTVVIKARTSGPLSPEIGMKVSVWVRGTVSFFPQ
ncbi:MAG: hypothetical protein RIS09_350 [Actinomycetota bacterium]|jgi:iron(III) transport system ATP-binding protein